jgi:hypothetical protein
MSNYRIKYGIIQNNLKYQFGLRRCDGLVQTIEMDISFAYWAAMASTAALHVCGRVLPDRVA